MVVALVFARLGAGAGRTLLLLARLVGFLFWRRTTPRLLLGGFLAKAGSGTSLSGKLVSLLLHFHGFRDHLLGPLCRNALKKIGVVCRHLLSQTLLLEAFPKVQIPRLTQIHPEDVRG